MKKKELSIKGRSFLLCKKCLNVICVRVWPGERRNWWPLEAIKRDGGKETRAEETEGEETETYRRKLFGKKSSLMDSLSRPSPANDSFPKSYPWSSSPPSPPLPLVHGPHTYTYTHASSLSSFTARGCPLQALLDNRVYLNIGGSC